jgi:very-short-patch-repair endonuclease
MDLRSLGDGSLGLWTRPQALALMTRGTLNRIASRSWQIPFTGVYADAGYELSAVQWAQAAVLASGGAGQPMEYGEPRADGSRRSRLVAVACGRSAARVWGLPLIDDADPATHATEYLLHDVQVWRSLPTMTAPARAGGPDRAGGSDRAGRPDRPQLRRHRLTGLGGGLMQHGTGLWLTTPLRTALDCVTLVSPEAAVCVLDDGLHRELFTSAELTAAVAARAGKPGATALRAAVASADGRSESPNETLARLLLQPTLPGLEPQVQLHDERGRLLARFDFGDRAVRLAVDMDGKRGHAGEQMVAKDRKRDRASARHGWWTERGTWWEVRRDQAAFVARVEQRWEVLRARAA